MSEPVVDLGRSAALRPLLLAGAAVAVAFFGGLGGWAATAPLVGAVVAPAVVAPVGQRKSIQHLEGGIVREILVREGESVAAAQPLVLLDDTQVRAELRELQAHWHARRAATARLVAESRGLDVVVFGADLLAARDRDPTLAAALAAESAQLVARRAALRSRIAVLERRAEKERQSMAGLAAAADSFSQQLALIHEEIEGVQQLRAKGLETKPRLLALQRARSQLEGDLASTNAGVREAREAIAEAELEALSLGAAQAAQVAEDLAQNQAEVAQLEERLATARDRLERATVRAPVAGTVMSVAVRASGAVTAPGATILDLVPAGVDLVLDARVAPQDVDEVHAGQPAQVYLTAYQTRRLPRLLGTVEWVSADLVTDDSAKTTYYAARVRLDPSEIARLGHGIALRPGMPAEAMLVTRERTMLDYLLAPLTGVFRHGLRET